MHCILNKCSIHTNTQLTCKRIFLLFMLHRSTILHRYIHLHWSQTWWRAILSVFLAFGPHLPIYLCQYYIYFFFKKYLVVPFIYAYIILWAFFLFGWPFDHLYRIHFPFSIQKFLVMAVVVLLLLYSSPFVFCCCCHLLFILRSSGIIARATCSVVRLAECILAL